MALVKRDLSLVMGNGVWLTKPIGDPPERPALRALNNKVEIWLTQSASVTIERIKTGGLLVTSGGISVHLSPEEATTVFASLLGLEVSHG